MYFNELILYLREWGPSDELFKTLELLDEDLPSPNGEAKYEDKLTKKEDAAKEERKPPCHEDAIGGSEDSHNGVHLDGSDGKPN